jgi:hypothetical protein
MSSFIIDDIEAAISLSGSTSLPFYNIRLDGVRENVEASFRYNYYTRDESVSETVNLSEVDRETDEYQFVLENYEKNTPARQIDLSFSTTHGFTGREIISLPKLKDIISSGSIIYEDAPFGGKFTSVGVYDTSLDEKVYNQYQSTSTGSAVEPTATQRSDFLNNAKLQSAGIRFSSRQTRQEVVDSYSDNIKGQVFYSSINNIFISDIVETVNIWQNSFYADEYAATFSRARVLQTQAVAEQTPLSIDASDCDVEIPPYETTAVYGGLPPTAPLNSITHVGYIIEKYGEQLDGSTKKYDDVVLTCEAPPNTPVRTYTDPNVRYEGVYKYKVRSVYSFTMYSSRRSGFSSTVNITTSSKFLIASRGTLKTVLCVENIPPKPPNNITFQQTLQGLYIRWNFPVNPQKDIKRFQVFRRRSILEPFELIQEINFDRSLSPYTTAETVPEELVVTSNAPIKHYVDTTFKNLSSDYIYALCSIDAHGYSSAYSEQFRIRFDRINAKLQIIRVSPEGAPKPYPNVNVLGDFFSDLIKDSSHSRIRLYFDPEYLNVTNNEGRSLNLISKSNMGLVNYRLSLTELNLAQTQNIDIYVSDNRLGTAGAIPPSIARFYIGR